MDWQPFAATAVVLATPVALWLITRKPRKACPRCGSSRVGAYCAGCGAAKGADERAGRELPMPRPAQRRPGIGGQHSRPAGARPVTPPAPPRSSVSVRNVVAGGDIVVVNGTMRHAAPCPACLGTGRDLVPYGERCEACGGTGVVAIPAEAKGPVR